MYLITRVADVDGDGKAEIAVLKSGHNKEGVSHPRKFAVYAHTGSSQLTLLDEVRIPTEYDDNMNLLWVYKGQFVIPVPERYVRGEPQRILRYSGFSLRDRKLVQEQLSFKWEYYNKAPLTLPPTLRVDDGTASTPGYLLIEDRKHLRFVKQLPSVLPH